jgi:histidinol-phosphatase
VNLSAVRDLALELADAADRIAMATFRRPFEVRHKADGSHVTAADEAIERLVRERVAAEFPDHRVLGEEHGQSGPSDPEAPVWIIDPIDGTANFVKGNPVFATLIGVFADGEDVLGVVSAPALGTRWDGGPGSGARQDGAAIRVSSVASLSEAEVSLGGLSDLELRTPGLIATLAGSTVRQRGFGDFWGYALLAAGSTDVVIEAALNRWDLAAVRALVLGAGGAVTDLEGIATAAGGSAVATNAALHAEVLELIGRHRVLA